MFLCRILQRILQKMLGSCAGSYGIFLCRILKNPVGSCEDFYDPKYIMYITGSLRESCKILIKGSNKEFLPGCLTEHLVHHSVCFSVRICVRSYTGRWIHAVLLAEIVLGFCDLLPNRRETVRNIYTGCPKKTQYV